MIISLNCFAQFNEPIQINEENAAIVARQDAYKVVGENVYITYKEEYYSTLFETDRWRIMFKFSEDNGQNFETTIVDTFLQSDEICPILDVLSNGTIIIGYMSFGNLKKAISLNNGNSFQIEDITTSAFKPIHITNQNDIIYIAVEDNESYVDQTNFFNQTENIFSSSTRDISQIEQNGLRPFPADAEIVYVKIDGNSYTSMIGNIEHFADSLFVVYNSYPDATHPEIHIGDPIWINGVAIYDTVWTAGPSGVINNQSVWVECELWIEGMVGGMQSWGCPEDIFITNDIYYENTGIGSAPHDPFNFNTTDFFGLYSEDRILIKYKHFDPFINEIVAPNCDGDIYIYGMMITPAEGDPPIFTNTGYFSFEYQHPHGSTTDFWWTNPATGEEEFLTYIDLHKFIYDPAEIVPPELEPFVLHGNNPPAGFPACGYPYESADYAQPDVPPYGTDFPWYNPVWPESSDDIVYERGTFHFYGVSVARRRGFFHRSGADPYNHPGDNVWDIENHHYDGYHSPVGYTKDFHYDMRFHLQSVVDISFYFMPRTDSYKLLFSTDNGNSFTLLDEQAMNEAINNLQMCANDSLLVVGYQESGNPIINYKSFDENNSINEFSIDLSSYPEITDPELLNLKLTDYLYIHVSNSNFYYFNNNDEFIIEYNLEYNEIENIISLSPDYKLTDFNISNGNVKLYSSCEMFIDEFNPEPLTLHFNYSDDNNWNDVYNLETDFINFLPYTSTIATEFSESDSLYILLNITDSLTAFGDIYLIPGSGDFLTDYSNIEIINEGIKLQSYPNPFNLETTISFSIPEESEVNITVYNVKGQKIKILESNIKSTGTHSIVWNGKDVNGNQVGSGVYLFRLNVNGKTQKVKKCLLLK